MLPAEVMHVLCIAVHLSFIVGKLEYVVFWFLGSSTGYGRVAFLWAPTARTKKCYIGVAAAGVLHLPSEVTGAVVCVTRRCVLELCLSWKKSRLHFGCCPPVSWKVRAGCCMFWLQRHQRIPEYIQLLVDVAACGEWVLEDAPPPIRISE